MKQDKPPRQIVAEVVNIKGSWAYFNGAAQGDPHSCGTGGVLFLNDDHILRFKAALGHGTNNFAKMMALEPILLFPNERGILRLQVFRNSITIIKWMRKEQNFLKFLLQPLLEEVQGVSTLYNFSPSFVLPCVQGKEHNY